MPVNTNEPNPKEQLIATLINRHLLVHELIDITMNNYHILEKSINPLQKYSTNSKINEIKGRLIQDCAKEIIAELTIAINDWMKALYNQQINENIIPHSYSYVVQQALSFMVKDDDLATQFENYPINDIYNGEVIIEPIDELIDETIGIELNVTELETDRKKDGYVN